METFMAYSRYDKKRKEEPRKYRYMTCEEAKKLAYGSHAKILDQYGNVADVKINGTPKTWKTRPFDVDIPWKYGMYEYGKERFRAHIPETDLVVEVKD